MLNCFKKHGGLSSFKKVKKYKSCTLKGELGYKIENSLITIKGISYKFIKSRNFEGKIKTVTIKRDNLGYFYICIAVENKKKVYTTSSKTVGIYFGLKNFLTLSNGV
ncbi:MAG: transposase OrfB [Candidatus Xenolissoclinum pacificiensis L6]|uniref:Transposase OrfB n=1 Tax=Candidatus Xenolissoclinum pacificiensis L6 TaxID=1401685 RepID=W2V1P5_9RICK|nr:MAG: transposase OrfB [Candidatus Xenolissoclinum pacificiensis L6]